MTIGIVGCGLIGGSIGLACRANTHVVLGYEPDFTAAKIGLDRGCVNQFLPLQEVSQAEVIFVCVPPGIVTDVLDQVIAAKPKHSVVTDCTSVKGSIVSWLQGNRDEMFVPGHPMAGHEKSGPQYASGWMFRGAKWILTPAAFTYSGAIQKVEALIKEMGAKPVRIKSERHDREVAVVSHLPHALAAVLVRMAQELDSTDAAAGSWKDLTRVGGVDPHLWTQILMGNREEVSKALFAFESDLANLRNLLDQNDSEGVRQFFEVAKQAKEKQK